MKMSARILSCVAAIIAFLTVGRGDSPDFGPHVLIFGPDASGMQERIAAIAAKQERSEFGNDRWALLFKPGSYNLDVRVGFYTQVAGLGRSPDDVTITGAVRSKTDWTSGHHALVNFWRGAENLSVIPTEDNQVNVWAVSQASYLRRIHIQGNLSLWDRGSSSGGFLADSLIDGVVNSGTQQQWLSRNDAWGRWTGSSWNMVFVGVTGAPMESWPNPPYTVVKSAPVIREKPFLCLNEKGDFGVYVPDLVAHDSLGISWAEHPTPGQMLPISRFYIAHPETDTATSLNAALAAGKDLLITPGNYRLETALNVTRPDTVVLGLGFPTLVPVKGNAILAVADVDGVKLAGLLLEAGPIESPVLLEVGTPGCTAVHGADPILLSDIFCRAGGASTGAVRCFVTVHSSDVIGDNFWLWRADHGQGAAWKMNRNANGLIVNGQNVTIYGLFVEHTQEYQTLWNGNGGRVYLYQSELPYDPPNQEAWMHDGHRGYTSYKVAPNVTTHEAWGLGIYAVFKQTPVILESAIECPSSPGVKFHHMVMFRLNKQLGSGINHLINGKGDEVVTGRNSRVDEW